MTFLEFCGNSSFWDNEVFTKNKPKFTECFISTIPALGPVGWLVLTFIFYVTGLKETTTSSIPFHATNVVKTGICVVLAVLSLFTLYTNNTSGFKCVGDDAIPTSYTVSCALITASFIYVAILTQINRRKGVISSWLLWIFWIFVVICCVVPLQDNILYQPTCISSILQYISFGFSCVQVVLYSLADSPSVYGYERIGKPVCPKSYASIISKLFFWWFTPIIRTCYKRTISKDDLWDQHPELQAEKVVNDLQLLWSKEENISIRRRILQESSLVRSEYNKNGNIPGEETALLQRSLSNEEDDPKLENPSLYKCCFQLYGLEWFRAAGLKICCDISILLQPLILKLIVNETEKPSEERVLWYGIVLAVLIFLLGQLDATFYIHSLQLMVTLGLKVKTALIGIIYRKTLKVNNSVRKDYTVGEIVNLVSVDCQRIQDAFTFSHEMLSYFSILTFGLYELWDVMGTSTVGCLVVIVILTSLNALFGKLQENYLKDILYYKGKRCKLLNEIIFGMKVIKMYAWEPYFWKKIRGIRLKEMAILRKIARVTACSIVCATHSPFMMNFAILLIYTLTVQTEPFSAGKAFLVLSVVNILSFPLTMIPFVITGVIQAFVSIKRIQQFLLTDDVNPQNVHFISHSDYAVSIQNGSFTWEKNTERSTLGGINVNIREGNLVAVVGHVGSGKSSFIASILGEMEKLAGEVRVKGSVAYVSQEAWIQNLSVKDNILYGHTFNERKYNRVIEGCCLKTDLEILTAGDMTEIGERGINVSGGQKQRINVARAVYSNSDIYLLDDPLSAVDSHVGQELFKKVIGPEGMLRHKTRILVTHGVHWLPKVDEIIVMDNGRISERGTFQQLLQHNGPFAQFLQVYLLHDDAPEEENDTEISKIKDEIWDQVESVTSEGGLTTDDSVFMQGGLSRRKSKLLVKHGSLIDLERSLSAAVMIKATMAMRERNLRESKASMSKKSLKTSIPDSTEGQLIKEETAQEGSVNLSVLIEFIKAMGIPATIMGLLALAAQQGLNIYQNFWITFWTEDIYIKNATLIHTQSYTDITFYYLGIYALLGVLQGITLFLFGMIAFTRFVKATGDIHDRGLNCILRSPMSFFDTTPVGRIMNRFSSDIDVIDDRFPRTFRMLSIMGFMLFGTIVVIIVTTPLSMAVIIPMLIVYIVIIKLYLPSARQLKRIESVTRSPIYNHFSETISGASIIRSYRSVNRFIDELYTRLDINSCFYYAANTGMGWIGIFIESLGNLILLAVALFGIISTDVNGGDIGLALTYAFQIIIAMNIVVRGVSEMQMNVVSIERCEEYMHLPPEADWIQRNKPPIDWPQKGTIKFCNYKTRYRIGLELVLSGVDCFIENGERVGIVGRTGAGKSSLTQALFRIIEPAEGSIVIDGITSTTIGLHELRRKITILPQDPVLFSDTLRVNLDPLGQFTDTEIWKALECAHLKDFAMNQTKQLMSELGEGGNNLSIGQRQLVCLARTLLHKTNILLLDEATAAVDMETDDLIQRTISEEFAECTILSIAHRLNTVMDYDRIMVLDKGTIVEFDAPDNLLRNKDGIFYSMAHDAGLV
ncbi:ATP-binding cassette sub-family C member 3-like isoform X1 [Mytilus galloprovincialis]|uniref:ATP-binding cassette sub-family C member 3-like isoform X1 n=1 Tax=Mytilus galloprovincialis TaxID=29158 RepID=UPI003F7CCF9F